MAARPELVDPLIVQNATRDATTPPVSSQCLCFRPIRPGWESGPVWVGSSLGPCSPEMTIGKHILKRQGSNVLTWLFMYMPGTVQSSSPYLYVASAFIPSASQNLLRATHRLPMLVVLFLTVGSELCRSSTFAWHITEAFPWEHCSALYT